MPSNSNFYDKFFRLYPIVDFFLRSQKRTLAKLVNQLPNGKLLEVGIGNGSILPYYQKHFVTGIDLADKMLEVARKRIAPPNTKLLNMGGEALSFKSGSFDYVVISHVIAVTKNPEVMLQEAYRVLRLGGTLLLHNHFTPSNPLMIIDYLIKQWSPIVRFSSVVKLSELESLLLFTESRNIKLGPIDYFNTLILKK